MTWSRKKRLALIGIPVAAALAFGGGYKLGLSIPNFSLGLGGPGDLVSNGAKWAFLFAELPQAQALLQANQELLRRKRPGDFYGGAAEKPRDPEAIETESIFKRGHAFQTSIMLSVLTEEANHPATSDEVAKHRVAAVAACMEGDALVSLSIARARAAIDGDPTEFCKDRQASASKGPHQKAPPPTQSECESLVAKKIEAARARRAEFVSSPK